MQSKYLSAPPVELLDEAPVAKALGISAASLRRWRILKKGPRYLKVGWRVKYHPDDIQSWLASRTIETNREAR